MRPSTLYSGNDEPGVPELLSDPIVHWLMRRDCVTLAEVYDLMDAAARRQGRQRDRTGSSAALAPVKA